MTPTLKGPSLAPASGEAPKQIVLLLHGYGSNGADLLSLAPMWRRELPDTLFVAPNAPERCPGAPGGYQWWALRSLNRADAAAGAARAAPAIDAYIDSLLAEHELAADRLLIVGFSQGSMMALHVGPRRERQIAGIAAYSGALADAGRYADEIRTKPPILLVHGTADSVVPVSAYHHALTELRRLGFAVEGRTIAGLDHGVDEEGIRAGGAFARKLFGA
jgi:phospholipase/carboxylesterase